MITEEYVKCAYVDRESLFRCGSLFSVWCLSHQLRFFMRSTMQRIQILLLEV